MIVGSNLRILVALTTLLVTLVESKILHLQQTQCSKNQFYNNTVSECQSCPDYAPVSDGSDCRACNYTSYYDAQAKTCSPCPKGQFYDSAHRYCKCPL